MNKDFNNIPGIKNSKKNFVLINYFLALSFNKSFLIRKANIYALKNKEFKTKSVY